MFRETKLILYRIAPNFKKLLFLFENEVFHFCSVPLLFADKLWSY
jgi:hypothetical protein